MFEALQQVVAPEIKEEETAAVRQQQLIEMQAELAEAQFNEAELSMEMAQSQLKELEGQLYLVKNVQTALEKEAGKEIVMDIFAKNELDMFMPEGQTFAEAETTVAVESVMETVKAAGKKVWEFIKKVIVAILDMIKRVFGVMATLEKVARNKKAGLLKMWKGSDIAEVEVKNVASPVAIEGYRLKVQQLLGAYHAFLAVDHITEDPKEWLDNFGKTNSFSIDPVTFKVYQAGDLKGKDITDAMTIEGTFNVTMDDINSIKFDTLMADVKKAHDTELKQMKALQKAIPKKDASELDVKLFKQVCPVVIQKAAAQSVGVKLDEGDDETENYRKIAADAVTKMNNLSSSTMSMASKYMINFVLKPSIALFNASGRSLGEALKEKAKAENEDK